MTVVHFDGNNIVDIRYMWAATVDEAVTRKGGEVGDYAVGDYPAGSTRDPETGEITPYTPPTPTTAELAAKIVVAQSLFCIQFRTVYAAEGAPAGPVTGTVKAFIAALLAALPSGDGEALTDTQRLEAMERWETASVIERANPLITLLAPVLFGDAEALSDADDAVVLAEYSRVSAVVDQLFIDAGSLEAA